MVVDRSVLSAKLSEFYDFAGKAVLYVGAGRGQLLEPSSRARSIVAIDADAKSLDGFREEAKTKWAGTPVSFVPRRFEGVKERGDVAYFEFCLHEMDDPRKSLEHARSLAPDVVVMDHLPGSEWIYYGAEEKEVQRSTDAVQSSGVRRSAKFSIDQRFKDHDELAARLADAGELSLKRAMELKGFKDIRIRMDYALFLL